MMFPGHFIEDNDRAWQPADSGVQRKVMSYTPELMVVKVRFDAGAVGYLHQHPHLQMSYVAEGSFEVSIGSETRLLKKGDVFMAPSGETHGVACREAGLLIDIFSPMREDFL